MKVDCAKKERKQCHGNVLALKTVKDTFHFVLFPSMSLFAREFS